MLFIEHHKWTGIVYISLSNNCDNLDITKSINPTNVVEIVVEKVILTAITLPWLVKIDKAYVSKKRDGMWSIRLPTVGTITPSYKSSNHLMETMSPKWMRRDFIHTNFQLNCGKCSAKVLQSKDCKRINDLPSEFWAEFMDFWHCHKPELDDAHVPILPNNTSLIPAEGEIALADSFIHCNSKWNSISIDIDDEQSFVKCKQCDELLGTLTLDGSVKLKKWKLEAEINGAVDKFTLTDYIIYQILNELKYNSTRFYILKDDQMSIKIWIFGIGSTIIINGIETMKNCLKILYTEDVASSAISGQSNIETLVIKEQNALQDFKNQLDALNGKLPSDIAHMMEWKVSYIACD